MRNYDTATGNYIAAARDGVISRVLMWITAKDRSDGSPETVGLWNGEEDRDFTINAGSRTYYGAGGLLGVDDIQAEVGLAVRFLNVTASPIDDAVIQAIRGYDARLAPVEIHRAFFDLDTRALVSEPHRIFKGWVNAIDLPTGPVDAEVAVSLSLASSARMLTRPLQLKKSNSSQKLRSDDRFRRYGDVTGSVNVFWGEEGPNNGNGGGGGGNAALPDFTRKNPSR